MKKVFARLMVLVLVLGGIFFWRTNQRKLIIQGG